MKKLYKALLLTSIILLMINCQQKVTKSEFATVEDNTNLTPNIIPPKEDNIENGGQGSSSTLKPLSEEELHILNANLFNYSINDSTPNRITDRPVRFGFKQNGRIDEPTLIDISKTEMVVTAKMVERSQGAMTAYLVGAIHTYYPDFSFNMYRIGINTMKLKEALPQEGLFVTIRLDFYIKDKRTAKLYALTERSFEFTVKRVAN